MSIDALDWEQLRTIALAAGLGSVLGIEREIAGKPAGIRTHIFVSAGSALMMILGQEIIDKFQESGESDLLSADPIRVLQAIVVGISFLGAGTIVNDGKEGVAGLTTAASIYLTAGIGVAVAVDRLELAAMITLFATLALVLIGRVEKYLGRWNESKNGHSKNHH